MAFVSRRACWFGGIVLGLGVAVLSAQQRLKPPAVYVEINPPDQVEGARILGDMRNVGLGGPYYQEFELRLLPRKGRESRLRGRWFGDRNESGPVTRVELTSVAGQTEVLLIQSGPQPAVWRLASDHAPVRVEGSDVMQPIAGTNLSAADLQLPFMFWTDFVYEGRTPFRGRPAYVFLLYPPPAAAEQLTGIGGARVFIDTQFHAPLQAQWVDDAGQPVKTITVIDLKRIKERWIVKSFEVRDDRTRDKTRLVVTAVDLDAKLPPELFTPNGPVGPADFTVPADQVTLIP
jgi:Outer membrane lipoprotein-sorting protein